MLQGNTLSLEVTSGEVDGLPNDGGHTGRYQIAPAQSNERPETSHDIGRPTDLHGRLLGQAACAGIPQALSFQ